MSEAWATILSPIQTSVHARTHIGHHLKIFAINLEHTPLHFHKCVSFVFEFFDCAPSKPIITQTSFNYYLSRFMIGKQMTNKNTHCTSNQHQSK